MPLSSAHRLSCGSERVTMAKRMSTKALLRHDRARVQRPADALVTKLLQAPHPGGRPATDIAGPVHELQSSLRALQNQISLQRDSRSQATVRALRAVDVSLSKLLQAHSETDPKQVMAALEVGLKAFAQASRQAMKAGSDWVL
jgi:hypothetical protein